MKEHTPEEIKHLLEDPYWLPTLQADKAYQRYEDDSPHGFIAVVFTQDGDGWLTVFSQQDPNEIKGSMRFRMPFFGGGQSPRVRNALLILAEAIRLDNLDHPQHRP